MLTTINRIFYNRLLKKDLLCFDNVIVKSLESLPCFFSPKETLLDLREIMLKRREKICKVVNYMLEILSIL